MSPDLESLVGGGTLLLSGPDGTIDDDITGQVSGLYVGDVRLLSRRVLTIDQHRLAPGAVRSGASERTVALLPEVGRNQTTDVMVVSTQTVSCAGLTETICIRNASHRPLTVAVELELASDFADPFVLRSDGRTFDTSGAERSADVTGAGVTLTFQRMHAGTRFSAATVVTAEPAPTSAPTASERTTSETVGARLKWAIDIPPDGTRTVDVRIEAAGPREGATVSKPVPTVARAPFTTRAHEDLAALLMPCPGMPELTVVGAGVPWFLTLFGRDSIITALLARPEMPNLMPQVLRALAATQADRVHPASVAEPGKIIHELRVSELATLGQVPYRRYYGSVDSTPLFLWALSTIQDESLQQALEPAARAALGWVRGPGGLDAHGFVRYTSDPHGLLHQGWKDSFDAVTHADGRIAGGPIALCEVQGYTWRAVTGAAELARTYWNDPALADELEEVAGRLQARFREQFWMPNHAFPALAIDGEGQRVEVVASNAGHLLLTGILDAEDAARVTARLMEPDLFSGWGIRTLSATAAAYQPTSYHNGSVWPHDTAMIAEGMRAYGHHDEARTLAQAIDDSATCFEGRLPELFYGFSRTDFPRPVAYTHAARPQAWSAAAACVARRILSGS
jgi:glycogen debranching enzyme